MKANRVNRCIPFYMALWVSCCLLFCGSGLGQAIQSEAQARLPEVSDVVFESIAQLYEYDRDIPLESRVVRQEELEDGNREKIVFRGVNNSRVPAYLTIPKTEAKEYPVAILIDGLEGSKERWFEDDSWPTGGKMTASLLRAGFAVFSLDATYHGERAKEYDHVTPPNPNVFPNEFRHMVLQTAIEHRRAIDYLSTRSDIDASRIGVIGLSMGGLITFELSSVEPRIKSAAAGVVPVLKRKELEAIDVCTFASHVRCGSFLMFMASEDTWYSMGEAREIFARIPISNKQFVEFDSGHQPPVEYIEKVTKWFAKHLK